jgi:serine/threonine protein kinase
VQGGSQRTPGLPLETLLDLMRHVVTGVRHLHSLGILHLDLRAANVLVVSGFSSGSQSYTVMISGLRVAHLVSPSERLSDVAGGSAGQISAVLTGNGASGPVQWMAPEVLAGKEHSLACMCAASPWSVL